MKTIIQQNGYRLIWQDNGGYKVDHISGEEMPLVTNDVNLAITCIDNWAKKKTVPAATETI